MDRVFVRFESVEQKIDALQGVAFEKSDRSAPKFSFAQPNVLRTAVTDAGRALLEKIGAKIFDDVQFKVFSGGEEEDSDGDEYGREPIDRWAQVAHAADLADAYSMKDVIEQIRAPEAWALTRGKGSTIVVVDTGVAGALKEFAHDRRSPLDLAGEFQGQHWVDSHGHGSMCASIAAASKAEGGRYDGVAPEATVLAARTNLSSDNLFEVYDELLRARAEGHLIGPVVISNSYGLYTCTPPNVMPADHPFMTEILLAIQSGMFVCFAAGNNHHDLLCHHDPTAAGPNSIWGPNSHDEVISVGTVNRDLTNCDPGTPHANSSRGPGEWAKTTIKPDCVAPTYGQVIWGTSLRKMRWWGTSGACPQIAGLAALVFSLSANRRHCSSSARME